MKALRSRQRPDAHQNDIRRPRRNFGKLFYGILLLSLLGWALSLFVGDKVLFSAKAQIQRDRIALEVTDLIQVNEVWVQAGDTVTAGMPILSYSRPNLHEKMVGLYLQLSAFEQRRAEIDTTRSISLRRIPIINQDIDRLRAELSRLKKLALMGVSIASTRINEVSAKLSQARDALARAEIDVTAPREIDLSHLVDEITRLENLGDVEILRAPSSGVLGKIRVDPGAVQTPGELLAEIYTGPSYGLLYLPPNYAFTMGKDQKFRLSKGADTTIGKISTVMPIATSPPVEIVAAFGSSGPFQLARVSLEQSSTFAVGQVVDVNFEGERPPASALRSLFGRY